jgi:hypothetical protein
MAIVRTKPKAKDVDAFLAKAPDAAPPGPKGVRKGNKLQISHTITPELLAQVDQAAAKTGQSRAALINMAIYQALQSGFSLNPQPRP